MKRLLLALLIAPTPVWAGCTTYIDTYTGQLKTQCVRDNADGSVRIPRCTMTIDPATGYPVQHCY
jgi:hypothetical protein